jgi:hypothetical protein
MTRLLPALSAFLTGPKPQSEFADLRTRAIHGPRPLAVADPGARAGLVNLRAAVAR